MNSDIIWQIARYALLAVGGYFTKKGYTDESTVTTIIAAIGTLFTAAWGIYVKVGTKAVPMATAQRVDVPTVSAATGAVQSGSTFTK